MNLQEQFITARNGNFFLGKEKIILRGFGLGSWMNIEHFMIGIPGTERMIRKAFEEVYGKEKAEKFFDNFINNFFTEDDASFLKTLGINCLRLALNYRRFEDDSKPGLYIEKSFKVIDRVIKICKKNNIRVILDMHTVPGGQNPDWHSDNDTGVVLFWRDKSLRDRTISLWKEFALRYKKETGVIGYDLVNEPCLVDDIDGFNDFFLRVCEEILKIDSNHLLFLEGDNWATDFSIFRSLAGKNRAISFHFYPGHHVDIEENSKSRKKKIHEYIKRFTDIRDKTGMALWCGETGSRLSKDMITKQKALIEDCLDVLEKEEISWTIWAYKDAQAMSMVFPKNSTLWMKFKKELGLSDIIKNDRKIADSILNELKIKDPLKYIVSFRILALLNFIHVEKILKPLLKKTPWKTVSKFPLSFLFKNCEFWQKIAVLIKKYTFK